jgi:hypothetical protein
MDVEANLDLPIGQNCAAEAYLKAEVAGSTVPHRLGGSCVADRAPSSASLLPHYYRFSVTSFHRILRGVRG